MWDLSEYLIRELEKEVQFSAIRAQGSGGQNVNKVSTAVYLRFSFACSSLPDWIKARLLKCKDDRITQDQDVVIKAQSYRSQPKNKDDALLRLRALIESAAEKKKYRVATKPSKGAKLRRLKSKTQHSQKKQSRAKPSY